VLRGDEPTITLLGDVTFDNFVTKKANDRLWKSTYELFGMSREVEGRGMGYFATMREEQGLFLNRLVRWIKG